MSLSYQSPPGGGGDGKYQHPLQRQRLRIAFIVPEDRRTGTYYRYHNLAVGLSQLGNRVTVYSQSNENRLRGSIEIRDGVTYVLSPTIPGNRWMLPPTNPGTFLRRLITHVEQADVYHLFQPFPTAALVWLWLRKWRHGLFVYDWDDFWINDDFGLKNPVDFRSRWTALWIRTLERKLPVHCHLTTTVSHPLAELARAWNSPRSTVVYNGVWPQARKDKRQARAVLGLDQEAFYAGLMGWSGEIDWCLEAIRRYATTFPNLRLAISGRDPNPRLAVCPDIASRVDYVGTLSDNKFGYFNASLDLGLVPMPATDFNHYRLPSKLTDHLAGGVPVLCSRVGETALLADELEGIFTCEPTLDAWLSKFGDVVARCSSASGDPGISTETLFREFSWLKISREMGAEYHAASVARSVPQAQMHG